MNAVSSLRDEDKFFLAKGFKIYKLDGSKWQIVTSSTALTVTLPEDLLASLTRNSAETVSNLIAKLSDRYDADSVRNFLNLLLNKRAIYLNSTCERSISTDSFFQYVNNGDIRQDSEFQASTYFCRVVGVGRARNDLDRLAREVGFQVLDESDTDNAPAIMLVVADSPNHHFFRNVNRTMSVPAGVPTIYSCIDARLVRIFRVLPGATACFECMHHRMRVGKTFWREFDAATSNTALWYPDKLVEPLMQAHQLAATTLMQATLMLAGQVHDLHNNSVIEMDSYNHAMTKSAVLKLPRCPVCGPGGASKPMPPIYTAKE